MLLSKTYIGNILYCPWTSYSWTAPWVKCKIASALSLYGCLPCLKVTGKGKHQSALKKKKQCVSIVHVQEVLGVCVWRCFHNSRGESQVAYFSIFKFFCISSPLPSLPSKYTVANWKERHEVNESWLRGKGLFRVAEMCGFYEYWDNSWVLLGWKDTFCVKIHHSCPFSWQAWLVSLQSCLEKNSQWFY